MTCRSPKKRKFLCLEMTIVIDTLAGLRTSLNLRSKFRISNKEYIRRVSLIWSFPLPIPRKFKATQTFAPLVLLHHMWTTDWPIGRLTETDRRPHKVISDNGCKHRQESLPLLYLPTLKGGRSLTEIETLYKTTKIMFSCYLSILVVR